VGLLGSRSVLQAASAALCDRYCKLHLPLPRPPRLTVPATSKFARRGRRSAFAAAGVALTRCPHLPVGNARLCTLLQAVHAIWALEFARASFVLDPCPPRMRSAPRIRRTIRMATSCLVAITAVSGFQRPHVCDRRRISWGWCPRLLQVRLRLACCCCRCRQPCGSVSCTQPCFKPLSAVIAGVPVWHIEAKDDHVMEQRRGERPVHRRGTMPRQGEGGGGAGALKAGGGRPRASSMYMAVPPAVALVTTTLTQCPAYELGSAFMTKNCPAAGQGGWAAAGSFGVAAVARAAAASA
jgi:hypothetical protein